MPRHMPKKCTQENKLMVWWKTNLVGTDTLKRRVITTGMLFPSVRVPDQLPEVRIVGDSV